MTDWVVYAENNKIKAWNLSKEENYYEVDEFLDSLGFDIVAKCSFAKECDAIDYGRYLESRKK